MLISQLFELVSDSLYKELYSNAVFYGERLLAENDCEEVKFLLARSYKGEGKFHKAYHILKDSKSHQCRYLFAEICLKLNNLVEGERALLTERHYTKNILSKEVESVIPHGSAGFYLLGLIAEKLNRPVDAINAFKKSLDLDPFMFCSFEKICKISPNKVDTSKVFSELNPKVIVFLKKVHNSASAASNNQSANVAPKGFSLSPDETTENPKDKTGGTSSQQTSRFNLISQNEEYDSNKVRSFNETSFHGNSAMTPIVNKGENDYRNMNYNHPIVKNREHRQTFASSNSPNNVMLEFHKSSEQQVQNISSANDVKSKFGGDSNKISPFCINLSSGFKEFTPHNLKNILQGSNKSNIEENTSNNNIFKNIQLIDHNLRSAVPSKLDISVKSSECGASQLSRFSDVPQLLKYYGDILKNLSLYQCEEAIELIKMVPYNHQKTGFILTVLARSYFELAKYKESEKIYRECLRLEPARLEGLEYYSICLWHLKSQYQLCNLAHHALEQSHFSPETWIVVGNCYSLQKEHEIALKFFSRATQINPNFAYAYTLCGHEYVDNESFSHAKQCYSQAIACDDRHFNAWWGLGNIHLKEQNYTEAIKFFKKAIHINGRSAILNFYLASAYQYKKELNKALILLSTAEKLDQFNPMIKYQKANILIHNRKYDEALSILLDLNEKMPKEAPIHILIGKIYKIKRDFTKSLAHLNAAIDIDPKDANLAKSMIEKLYSEESEGDSAYY